MIGVVVRFGGHRDRVVEAVDDGCVNWIIVQLVEAQSNMEVFWSPGPPIVAAVVAVRAGKSWAPNYSQQSTKGKLGFGALRWWVSTLRCACTGIVVVGVVDVVGIELDVVVGAVVGAVATATYVTILTLVLGWGWRCCF